MWLKSLPSLSKSETGEYGTDLLRVRSKILPFSGELGVESVPEIEK